MKTKHLVSVAVICAALILAGAKCNKDKPVIQQIGTAAAQQEANIAILGQIEKLQQQLTTIKKETDALKLELNSKKDTDLKLTIIKKQLEELQAQQGTTPRVITQTEPAATASSVDVQKIAIADFRYLFQNCQQNAVYQQTIAAEQNRIIAELDKLKRQAEATQADMKTRKLGSDDYIALMRQLTEQQASFEAKKDFYQQQMSLQDRIWTEKLIEQIMASIGTIAKKKNIDMVFAKDVLDLENTDASELMLAIRTHKLLYGSDALEITKEVLEHLDAQE